MSGEPLWADSVRVLDAAARLRQPIDMPLAVGASVGDARSDDALRMLVDLVGRSSEGVGAVTQVIADDATATLLGVLAADEG